jgi:hypothetical protein
MPEGASRNDDITCGMWSNLGHALSSCRDRDGEAVRHAPPACMILSRPELAAVVSLVQMYPSSQGAVCYVALTWYWLVPHDWR